MAGTFLDNLTIDDVAALFPPSANERIKVNWPLIAEQLKERHLTSREAVLYVLGTIDAETKPTFAPDPEQSSKRSQTVDKAGYAGIQDAGTVRPFGKYDSTIRFAKGKPIIKQLGNEYYRGKDDALMRGAGVAQDRTDRDRLRRRAGKESRQGGGCESDGTTETVDGDPSYHAMTCVC